MEVRAITVSALFNLSMLFFASHLAFAAECDETVEIVTIQWQSVSAQIVQDVAAEFELPHGGRVDDVERFKMILRRNVVVIADRIQCMLDDSKSIQPKPPETPESDTLRI